VTSELTLTSGATKTTGRGLVNLNGGTWWGECAWWAGITAACLVSCGKFKIFTGKREKDGAWGPDGRDNGDGSPAFDWFVFFSRRLVCLRHGLCH
jgi:hypothetical protein